MKVQYFPDTDTLYIELIDAPSVESEEKHFTERFRGKPTEIPLKLTPITKDEKVQS